ncbi:MAG TPA: TGS domain-containing protein, partial [Chloroflexota bacterium]|nr:TGS domain-containing protein [Chloroflexota bacterium]
EKYKEIATLLASRRESREQYVADLVQKLNNALRKAGITAEVYGRPKHIYSIYRKMVERGVGFDHIYDLAAVRVIVEKKPECYLVLGVVHCLWPPIPGQFDDYIALPKASGYRSLHTAVMGPEGKSLEIQIRTREMHKAAEFGVAAHWRYKEGEKRDLKLEQRVAWLRHLLEWQREMAGAQDFVESLKTDVFSDQVYVFTPKGEIRELPAGSTPLDFAYYIHSDIGHRCIAAMVNHKPVTLDYRLQNGDQVDIITSPDSRGPTAEWLNPSLRLVRTTRARTAIRQYLRRRQREENVARGRQQMDAEISRLRLPSADLNQTAEMLEYQSAEDLLAAVGSGEVSSEDVVSGLSGGELPKKGIDPTEMGVSISQVRGTEALGNGEQVNRLARCCNPVPGEPIAGYLTLGKGITVHRLDCPNLMAGNGDRIVPVRWGPMEATQFPVALRLEADDLEGVLRDVAVILAEEPAAMTSLTAETKPNGYTTVRLNLNVSGAAELGQVISRLEDVTGVQKVTREAI